MALITQQNLTDAALDAASLSSFVNGAAGTITTRLGRVLKTLAQVIADAQVATIPIAWFLATAPNSNVDGTSWTINSSRNISAVVVSNSGAALKATFTVPPPDAYYTVNGAVGYSPIGGNRLSIPTKNMLSSTASDAYLSFLIWTTAGSDASTSVVAQFGTQVSCIFYR